MKKSSGNGVMVMRVRVLCVVRCASRAELLYIDIDSYIKL